jgi:hypothetical protein
MGEVATGDRQKRTSNERHIRDLALLHEALRVVAQEYTVNAREPREDEGLCEILG